MKRFQKSTAIALSIVFAVVLAIGFVFSFIPMTFGSKTLVSFSGALNISSDITGGLYGEYDINTNNATTAEIIDSMELIKDVLQENGYKNANVYAIGNKKIRAEISYPKGDSTYSSAFSELTNLAAGAFSLRSTYELEDSSIVLPGASCVEKVSITTYNDTKSMIVKFNESGEEKFRELCNASSTVYLVLGEYSQSITISGVTDYSQLTLQNTDYENLVALEQKIKLGCMKVELNSSTAVVNTMSASLSAGEAASSPVFKSFGSSTVLVVALSASLAIVVLGLAMFAIKFGWYAVLMLATLLLNAELFLILMCLIPSFEIGLSTIAAMIVGVALIYTYAFAYANKVKSEYNLGKSLNAALEISYKKQLPSVIMTNVMMFLSSLIVYAFSFGELASVSIAFTVCTFLSLLTNLFVVPFLVKICISFGNFGRKLFMLKKRAGISSIEEDLAKEAE